MLQKYIFASLLFGTLLIFPAYAENTTQKNDHEQMEQTPEIEETETSVKEEQNEKENKAEESNVRFIVKTKDGEIAEDRTIYIKDKNGKQLASFLSNNDENGVIATNEEEPFTLPRNEILYAYIETTDGIYSPAVEFHIPNDPLDDQYVEIFEYPYGTSNVITYVEGSEEIIDVSYGVYTDAQAETAAMSVYGEKAEGNIFDLEPGSYYLKELSSDENYYKNVEIIPFTVTAKEKVEIIRYVKPVIISLSSCFNEGTPNGTIELTDSSGTSLQTIPISKETVEYPLQRNKDYTLKVNPVDGYYPIQPISFQTEEIMGEPLELSIPFDRTHVTITAIDEITSAGIDGASLSIYDEKGTYITAFRTSENGNVIPGLTAGKRYEIREKTSPDHFLPAENYTFHVPVDPSQDNLTILIPHTPYVSLHLGIHGGTDGAEYTVYQNEACTEKAADIFGSMMEGIYHGENVIYDVKNGTYYLKITKPSLYCYPTDEVFPVTADHTKSNNVSVTANESKAEYRFSLKSSANDEPLAGSIVEIKDEKGKKTIAKWILSSNEEGDLPMLSDREVSLEPGKIYQINTLSLTKHYWREHQSIRFITNGKKPQTTPCITLKAEPYITYTLKGNESLAAYVLYLDEACTNQAKDIYGQNVNLDSEHMSADLSEGTYWLKMKNHVRGWYKDIEAHEIQLSMEQGFEQEQEVQLDPIQVYISAEDENGEPLSGAEFVLYNAEGKKLDSWISEKKPYHFIGNAVSAGDSISIHQVSASDGYEPLAADIVIAIPQICPSQIQTIHLKNEKIPITKQERIIREWINPKENETIKEEDISTKRKTKVPVYAFMTAGFICAFLGFKRYKQTRVKKAG